MSDDPKPKDRSFDYSMMSFFGLDLGRELGFLDSRLSRVGNDVQKLAAKLEMVDGRVDKCLVAINRLDERGKNLTILGGGILIAVMAGMVLQIIFR